MQPVSVPATGRDRALDHIQSQILTDSSLQGSFLNEKELAERIGVSRTPVREALLILASQGFIEMIPQRGARVPVISARQIRELVELRGLLERHAVHAVIDGDPHLLEEMEAALEKQAALVEVGDMSADATALEFIEWDQQFHQIMANATGNDLIASTYSRLRARQVLIGIRALIARGGHPGRVCEEHRAILDALKARDAVAAETAIDDHLAATLDALLRS